MWTVKSIGLFPDTSKKSQKEGEKNEIVLAPATILDPDAETVKPTKADSKGKYSLLSTEGSRPNLNYQDFYVLQNSLLLAQKFNLALSSWFFCFTVIQKDIYNWTHA